MCGGWKGLASNTDLSSTRVGINGLLEFIGVPSGTALLRNCSREGCAYTTTAFARMRDSLGSSQYRGPSI
jgi:hypothetical protein